MSANTFRLVVVVIVLLFVFGVAKCEATVEPKPSAEWPDAAARTLTSR